MGQSTSIFLAFVGGVFLAMHAGFNTQLNVQLKSPIVTLLAVYIASTLFVFLVLSIVNPSFPSFGQLKEVPFYLWFSGALFSVAGIALYYHTIPKLGISTMVSIGLFGQIIFSVVAGHFGWFGLPVEPVASKKLIGIVAMTLGIILIKN
ncbi:DMT family transporter [Flagellimonas sp.]|uniref:DMT family transporter n=1 Tax=Flagellimonas sp. TaxID=2058762 RepID=UPI003B591FFE